MKSSIKSLLCICVVFGTQVLSGQQISAPPGSAVADITSATAPSGAGTEITPAPARPFTPRVSPGDLLDISVYGVPELTQKVRVSSSGAISLPLIDRVEVLGLTSEQVQVALEQRLLAGGFLNRPHVTVLISEYGSGVNLLGEIVRPGVYPVPGSGRLLDVIAAAGGLTAAAGKLVTISRHDQPEPLSVVLSGDPTETLQGNVEVRQGDTIIVSRAGVVYVVGEVNKPSGFIMEHSQTLTVLKAIAMANGTTSMAALDASKIIRKKPTGEVQEIPISLKKILQAKVADQALNPDDIVFVPSSKGKNVAVRSLETLVQIGTGITLRRF